MVRDGASHLLTMKMNHLLRPHPEEHRVSDASRKMTGQRSGTAFPSREINASGSLQTTSLRKQRAQGMPGARRTRSSACKIKKHADKSPQVRRNIPALPARMVLTASFVLSPAIGLFVTVPDAMRSIVTGLMSASRHQDHTTSPSALSARRPARQGVHRILRQRS